MRKITAIAIAAAAAATFAAPSASACHSAPTAGGTEVGDPAVGVVYAGSDGSGQGGFIGEKSDRGYIQADGNASTGANVHGGNSVVNGSLHAGPDGARACLNDTTII